MKNVETSPTDATPDPALTSASSNEALAAYLDDLADCCEGEPSNNAWNLQTCANRLRSARAGDAAIPQLDKADAFLWEWWTRPIRRDSDDNPAEGGCLVCPVGYENADRPSLRCGQFFAMREDFDRHIRERHGLRYSEIEARVNAGNWHSLYVAWRKRAEEAEAALGAVPPTSTTTLPEWGEKLATAWTEYTDTFGAEPHGTAKQMAALAALAGLGTPRPDTSVGPT